MKTELMEILVCPVCKGKLELEVQEEDKGEVIAGCLTCDACNLSYPISDGIPNMLPPELRGSA